MTGAGSGLRSMASGINLQATKYSNDPMGLLKSTQTPQAVTQDDKGKGKDEDVLAEAVMDEGEEEEYYDEEQEIQ